jgi:hypothetical protein
MTDHDDRVAEPGQELVARLQTAGDVLPDSLREVAFGTDEEDPPSIFVEAAEGVTTFGGINGHPGTPQALDWMREQLKKVTLPDKPSAAPQP